MYFSDVPTHRGLQFICTGKMRRKLGGDCLEENSFLFQMTTILMLKLGRDILTRMGAGALATLSYIQLRLNILIMLLKITYTTSILIMICYSFSKFTFPGVSSWRSLFSAGLLPGHICSHPRNQELPSAWKTDHLVWRSQKIVCSDRVLRFKATEQGLRVEQVVACQDWLRF